MSWIVSVFFNAPLPLDGVIDRVEELWLIEFKKRQSSGEAVYHFGGLGLSLSLFDDHGLVDNMGISFSKYEYELDFSVYTAEEGREALRRSMALHAARVFYGRFGWPCTVVENLQQKLIELPGEE